MFQPGDLHHPYLPGVVSRWFFLASLPQPDPHEDERALPSLVRIFPSALDDLGGESSGPRDALFSAGSLGLRTKDLGPLWFGLVQLLAVGFPTQKGHKHRHGQGGNEER